MPEPTQPFQYGELRRSEEILSLRLKHMGISDAKSLVQNYLKSKQDKAQKKINEQIEKLIK